MRKKLGAFAAILVLSGCAIEPDLGDVERPDPVLTATPRIDAPFDLGAVRRIARLSFREEADGSLVGGAPTYRAIADDAAVRVAPIDWTGVEDGSGDPLEGSAIAFETDSIARHETGALPLLTRDVRIGDLGEVQIDRGITVEQWRNDDDGSEQSWTFAAMPPGEGDLEIRVAVEGYEYVRQTESGHHFSDPESGLHVQYGRAHWVDADNQRVEVPVSFENGLLVLRVPQDVVDTAAYPAVLDPTVSPERVVGSPVAGPNAFDEAEPDAAFDGTNFLVVWGDQRSGLAYNVFGARVNGSGTVLDTRGILIASGVDNKRSPTVAWNGTEYLVAWQDERGADTDIYAQRVASTGTLSGSEIAVTTATGNQTSVSAVAAGSTWVLTWSDARSGTPDAYVARIDATGSVLDSGGVPVEATAVRRDFPAIACTTATCFVAWESGASAVDLVGATYDPATGTSGAEITIAAAANGQRRPSVGTDGTGFLVAWHDERLGGSNTDIYTIGVTAAGVLDAAAVRVTSATGNQTLPDVAWAGTNYLVVWQDTRAGSTNRDVYAQRLDAAHALAGTEVAVITLTGNQESPAVTTGGTTRWLVAWSDARTTQTSGQHDVYAARISTTGTNLDGTGKRLSLTGNRQTLASVASNGTSFLVAWADARTTDGTFDVWGALFSSSGSLVRTRVIANAAADQLTPGIAWDATSGQFLVVWHDQRGGNFDIYGALVTATSSDFTVGGGFLIAGGTGDQRRARASSNGANWLVVFEDRASGTSDIYGQRVAPDGTLAGALISIRVATGDDTRPDVETDGTDWFVVWTDGRGGSSNLDVYGRPVSSGGGLFAEVAISNAANNQEAPSIASAGAGEFLVAWADSRADVTSSDLYGSRISGGTVLDGSGLALSTTADAESRPSIVHQSGYYVLAFTRYNATTTAQDLWGVRLTVAGGVAETPFLISGESTNEKDPAMAVAGTRVAVAYSRYVAGSPSDTERVMARFMTFSGTPTGTACTTGSQCDSGFCVDGFCCNSACGGGLAGDCQACAAALGATADGTCSPVNAGSVCRASISGCDLAETCTGTSTACPADTVQSAGYVCRAPSQLCQAAATCDGTSAICPANPIAAAGTVCRAADQTCELDATCNGVSTSCPTNPVAPAGTFCRAPDQLCELNANCDGVNAWCPANPLAPAGTMCRSANAPCDNTAEYCSGTAPQCAADDNTSC